MNQTFFTLIVFAESERRTLYEYVNIVNLQTLQSSRSSASKAARVWRRAFEPWGNGSPWAGALARAAECHAA